METNTNDFEYRFEIRGSKGQVRRAKTSVREADGEFQEVDNDFSEEHARHLQLFAKIAAEFAKAATPRFDKKRLIERVNAAALRRADGSAKSPKTNHSIETSPAVNPGRRRVRSRPRRR